jgi:hypothetical protein
MQTDSDRGHPLKFFAGLWITVVVAISLQPLRPPHGSGLSRLHRPAHFLLFGFTAFILSRLFAAINWRQLPRYIASRPWVIAIVSTAALGLAIELLQHLIYHNQMEWWDVRDDAIAAALAILLDLAARAALVPRRS